MVKKKSGLNKQSDDAKKQLRKKSPLKNDGIDDIDKKNNNLITTLNKPKSIVELKEQKIDEKREILYFTQNELELGLKQKRKLKEFVGIIKNKPIRVVITTSLEKNDNQFKKYKKLLKSRALNIRTFLINQGISHNRIRLELKEKKISKNWKNEVILSFIGV